MKTIKPFLYSHPIMPNNRITIVGAGNVAKSLLLTASLLRPNIKFRVITRSAKSSELLRCFLNDIPNIDVDIETLPVIPDLSNELVILTLGAKTAKKSKKSKKESLFKQNQLLIESILEQIKSSIVIVVTNPSTAITKYLVENGIQAYGIGVANDQLRFNNVNKRATNDLYFVGAHNFHELVIGSFNSKEKINADFKHIKYKEILAKQDNLKFSFPKFNLEYDWEKLEKTNASFPKEYQWYARQRIHSKYHNTTISCSLAILNAVCFFTQNQPLYNSLSLEMPIFLPNNDSDVVVGWPIDGLSMQPLELTFGELEVNRLNEIAHQYSLQSTSIKDFYLISPFGDTILLKGDPETIHLFYQTRLAYLFNISREKRVQNSPIAEITLHLSDYNNILDLKNLEWKMYPQHRGKNPQEFTDINIAVNQGIRFVKFPNCDIMGKSINLERKLELYYLEKNDLFHELRRLIRDEIGIPAFVSHGARVLHAGIIQFKGINILITGGSGSGKTTAILSLLTSDKETGYGSSERTLIWKKDKNIVAMGVPESVTVFPGTLLQIPEFEVLVRGVNKGLIWEPKEKMRLHAHDIIKRASCYPIINEMPIDLIIEVSYDASLNGVESEEISSIEFYKRIILENDITEHDNVRLPWLNWIDTKYSNELLDFIKENQIIEAHSIKWSNIEALKTEMINIIARKKFFNSDIQATLNI